LGGVPTGTMKSSEMEIAAKIVRSLVSMPTENAKGITMGINIAAVAVLLANAVNIMPSKATENKIKTSGWPKITVLMYDASILSKPEKFIAEPRLNPLPNNISAGQLIFEKSFISNNPNK